MRILLTATAYPPSVGGAQEYAHQLLKQLRPAGHDVQAVCHWDENRTDWLFGTSIKAPGTPKEYEIDGIHVVRLGLDLRTRLAVAPWLPLYPILQGFAARRIGGALAREIKKHVQPADIVHNIRIGRAGLSYASRLLAVDWDVPFTFTPLHHPRWSSWINREYRSLYRTAELLIALTPTGQASLQELGAPDARVLVTGMGPILSEHADPKRFRDTYGLNGPIVLFLGQKYRYKNFDLLLSVADQFEISHAGVHFVFIGPRTRYSIRRFRRVSQSNVLELPEVDLQTKTDALAACDILCVPSSQESFGAVFLEAWMFEKPVIGGSASALRDIISDGSDGFLSTGEHENLANLIETLLESPVRRREMGKRGREKVTGRYSWPELAHKTEHAFELAIAAHRGELGG